VDAVVYTIGKAVIDPRHWPNARNLGLGLPLTCLACSGSRRRRGFSLDRGDGYYRGIRIISALLR
jgi:hypothetical protein